MKVVRLCVLLCGCLAALAVTAADKPAKPDGWKPTLEPVDEPLTPGVGLVQDGDLTLIKHGFAK